MKFKLISRLGLTILVMVAIALIAPVRAVAAGTPGQYALEIPKVSGTADWSVPTYGNGYLVSFCVVGCTNTLTLSLSHIVPVGDGTLITTAVEATAAVDTWYAWPTEYIQPPDTNTVPRVPVSLIPGDLLRCTLSATNHAATVIFRATGR